MSVDSTILPTWAQDKPKATLASESSGETITFAAGIVPKLFQPVEVGTMKLSHRVVLAPLTRFRANAAHVHGDLAVEYYSQRASAPGTLVITEATHIAARAGGYNNVPGIYNDEQIAAWKRVTEAVHAKGSYIYLQLWAMGRAGKPEVLEAEDPSIPYVSASDIPLKGYSKAPRPLTAEEIAEYVRLFAQAAKNAVHGAGFDGVEVHGANGYLLDQFLQDVSNTRTDAYGGSVENRCRFALAAVDAVVQAVGAHRTAIRLSPWSTFQEMGMADPKPTFSFLVEHLVERYPDMAYIHLSNDFIRELWAPRPLISAGGYTRALALKQSELTGELVAFGRIYIANPDLPVRLQKGLPLTKQDRSTFYGPQTAKGYTDYPFVDEENLNLKNVL
ncbi:hypothetical protein B0H21DRAFT_823025 [Amylocystis lapponica]|nr:hypothetical protein B0H21DRAFT_823025 [Amylocystis lapponica]